jgi:hypothetical protein
MKMNKLLAGLLAATFILGACADDTETDTETATETPDTSEEVEAPDDTEYEAEEDTDEEVEETEELEPEETTEGETEETELGVLTTHSQTLDINESQENGPFTITLLNANLAELEPSEMYADFFDHDVVTLVGLEVEVQNTTSDTNSIYPDQGTIVTNTGNQVDADLFFSDDVGGDFLGEVTKSGTVFFFFDGDTESIENVRYVIGSGHGEDWENFGEDIEFSVDF